MKNKNTKIIYIKISNHTTIFLFALIFSTGLEGLRWGEY
jgi:hypothetical protein